jgi:proline iminopeptidase
MAAMPTAEPFADLPPLATCLLEVTGGHRLHVGQWGCATGRPALVLHGGPGSGCSPLLRRGFDPARWRVVCVDQRGAGLSRPRAGLAHNTTAELLADLRAIREALGIARWLVVGGSWGATLAVLHAHDDPQAVDGLLLRSSFLARPADIDGFFRDAPAALREGWRGLVAAPAPRQRALALAWWRWERKACGHAGALAEPTAAELDALVMRYRIQSHYLAQGCFLAQPLAETAAALAPVPTLLLHGTADRVCPPEGALALQRAMPHARLRWIEAAGHDPAHPGMAAAMTHALAHWPA